MVLWNVNCNASCAAFTSLCCWSYVECDLLYCFEDKVYFNSYSGIHLSCHMNLEDKMSQTYQLIAID